MRWAELGIGIRKLRVLHHLVFKHLVIRAVIGMRGLRGTALLLLLGGVLIKAQSLAPCEGIFHVFEHLAIHAGIARMNRLLKLGDPLVFTGPCRNAVRNSGRS